MCASLRVTETRRHNESKGCPAAEVRSVVFGQQRIIDRPILLLGRFDYEHICWDPKDGELCLSRVKPEETLVEARSDSDKLKSFLLDHVNGR